MGFCDFDGQPVCCDPSLEELRCCLPRDSHICPRWRMMCFCSAHMLRGAFTQVMDFLSGNIEGKHQGLWVCLCPAADVCYVGVSRGSGLQATDYPVKAEVYRFCSTSITKCNCSKKDCFPQQKCTYIEIDIWNGVIVAILVYYSAFWCRIKQMCWAR